MTVYHESVTSEHRNRVGSWFPWPALSGVEGSRNPREWGTRQVARRTAPHFLGDSEETKNLGHPSVRDSHVSKPARHGAPGRVLERQGANTLMLSAPIEIPSG
jgi:hypothetical protein